MTTKHGKPYSEKSIIAGALTTVMSLHKKGILKLTQRQVTPLRKYYEDMTKKSNTQTNISLPS